MLYSSSQILYLFLPKQIMIICSPGDEACFFQAHQLTVCIVTNLLCVSSSIIRQRSQWRVQQMTVQAYQIFSQIKSQQKCIMTDFKNQSRPQTTQQTDSRKWTSQIAQQSTQKLEYIIRISIYFDFFLCKFGNYSQTVNQFEPLLIIIYIFYDMEVFSHPLIIKRLIWSICLIRITGGFICNGDFEIYPTNFRSIGSQHQIIPSNTSCWYDSNLADIQIKQYFSPATSKGVQLISNQVINLCQMITLTVGESYLLSFDFFCPEGLQAMEFQVTLNNISLTSAFLPNQTTFYSDSIIFQAPVDLNELCFSQTHITIGTLFLRGGLVDNITLAYVPPIINNMTENSTNSTISENQVTTIKYAVNFQIAPSEINSFIKFTSNLSYESKYRVQFIKNIVFFITGKKETDAQARNSSGFIEFIVGITQVKDLQEIAIFISPILNSNTLIIFEPNFQGRKSYFNILTEKNKEIIEILSPSITTITQVLKTIYISVSSSFCSYFIFSLFSYGNLTLMYFFLPIKSVPLFVREIYKITIKMLYEQTSLINWMASNFGLDKSIFKLSYEEKIREKIEELKSGFEWFGHFEFSSKIMINNADYFVILGLLLVKIFILRLLYAIINLKFSISWNFRVDLSLVFFIELLTLVPFLLISCTSVSQQSNTNYYEKIEKSVQLVILLICIVSLPIYIIMKNSSIYNDLRSKKKEEDKLLKRLLFLQDQAFKTSCKKRRQKHIRKIQQQKQDQLRSNNNKWKQEEIIQAKCETSQMLLYITIPILVYLQYLNIFFAIHFFILSERCVCIIRNFHHLPLREKVFQPFIGLSWIIHHTSFFILYILDMVQNYDDSFISGVRVLTGVLTLWTIIIGMALEFLRCLIEILTLLYKIWRGLKYCWKKREFNNEGENKYLKSNRIKPEQRNKQIIKIKKVGDQKKQQKRVWDIKVEDYIQRKESK